jgi:hypothetical protein
MKRPSFLSAWCSFAVARFFVVFISFAKKEKLGKKLVTPKQEFVKNVDF